MFEPILGKYDFKGRFTFQPHESLEKKCNAPDDQAGVYLIYQSPESPDNLLYIGRSGSKQNGVVRVRQGGLRDRIVNGYHSKFGHKRRRTAFPAEMIRAGIEEILICWWVTCGAANSDSPGEVEDALQDAYRAAYGRLPDWHGSPRSKRA